MISNQQYLKVAVEAAKKCGPLFSKYFGNAKDIQMKNNDPRNLVTEIDKAIEQQIRKTIVKKFPAHKIIGEEYSQDIVNKTDWVWIIDPIDGTTNYIQGIPLCCISIALWSHKGPQVGVIYNPILNQLFTAIAGKGAKLNNLTIKASKKNKLENAFGGVGWLKVKQGIKLFSIMANNSRKLRVLATSALQICLVASGNLDFYVTNDIKIWDFAAAIVIAKEAGAKITDWQGRRPDLNTISMVATNGKIHQQLLSKLRH